MRPSGQGEAVDPLIPDRR